MSLVLCPRVWQAIVMGCGYGGSGRGLVGMGLIWVGERYGFKF